MVRLGSLVGRWAIEALGWVIAFLGTAAVSSLLRRVEKGEGDWPKTRRRLLSVTDVQPRRAAKRLTPSKPGVRNFGARPAHVRCTLGAQLVRGPGPL